MNLKIRFFRQSVMHRRPMAHRKSLRLKESGCTTPVGFFVSLAALSGQHLFGEVQSGKLLLSPYGEIAEAAWKALPRRFALVLDAWTLGPNGLCGILFFVNEENGQTPQIAVESFQSLTAEKINALRGTPGAQVWQGEPILRPICSEAGLERLRQEILRQPLLQDSGRAPYSSTDQNS